MSVSEFVGAGWRSAERVAARAAAPDLATAGADARVAPHVVGAAALAFAVRVALVIGMPAQWHFDAYQRWAARDALAVQVWLPGAQAVVAGSAAAGLDIAGMRIVQSAVAALAVGLAVALAGRLGGARAAMCAYPLAVFGPFLTWSAVPYPESTLLVGLLGGLLTVRRWPMVADLLVGSTALVRYEAWPVVLGWVALRRTPRAAVAVWGAALWAGLRAAGALEPVAASPDSFADWEGMGGRWSAARLADLGTTLYYQSTGAGLPWLVPFAALGLGRHVEGIERRGLLLALAVQGAATVGWLAGLGRATSRMLVTPGVLLGVLAAVGLAGALARAGTRARAGAAVGLVALSVWSAADGVEDAARYARMVGPEWRLLGWMQMCRADSWAIDPRPQPGPRMRHDGCEAIQGLSALRAGTDFDCTPWGWGGPAPTLAATWDPRAHRYGVVRLGGTSTVGCPW